MLARAQDEACLFLTVIEMKGNLLLSLDSQAARAKVTLRMKGALLGAF